ncbi:MAG TPA: ferredoxin reductase family protein [Trebonia sp.]|jgi:predicted ferric reductase|nr:ferredoxin reductase family protein [Trebonia sp.]
MHVDKETGAVRRSAPAPRPGVVDACAAAAGLGLCAVLAVVVTGESAGALRAPGGLLTAGGRLAGFTGAYLILIMVVLVARLPWLERAAGQDRLVRWHRRVSPWALGLIAAHVALITLGYAQAAQSGMLHEVWVLLASYPDMLAAFAGFGLLALAGVSSVRIVKRRMRYETWWVVHLYLYLGLALAFAHQIATGASFIGHPLVRDLWITIWSATGGMVLAFRVLLPIGRTLRHQLRVVAVRPEAPGVVAVICQGRRLDRLPVSGGQFFLWRFLTRDMWWQAHPYSLSALPSGQYLRITIKGLGDQSRAAARLRPGTRVAIEGPYGAFTSHVRTSEAVVLIGAGVGVTPLRAMLEDLPHWTDVVVVVRASTVGDLIHRREVADLVRQRGGRLYELVGSRHRVRFDAHTLSRIVPDIAARDVYVCGPSGFSSEVASIARRLRVPGEQVHLEAFGF